MLLAFVSFAMAVAPALILVRYFYRQDRARPEPKGLVVRVFAVGLLSALAAAPLELLVGLFQRAFDPRSVWYHLFKAFVVAGLVEEYIKLTVVRLTVYRTPAFDEVMDGVVYTVVAGLGFACMENVLYVMRSSLATALVRAFTAVPLHAVSSGLMGYCVGRARLAASVPEERAWLRRGLAVAVGVHGTYDFLLFVAPLWGGWTSALVVPLVVGGFFALRARMRSALAADQARAGGPAGPGGSAGGENAEGMEAGHDQPT